MHRRFLLLSIAVLFFLNGCTPKQNTETPAPPKFTVAKAFSHDVTAFTQGLTIYNGRMFESTGQNNSWIAEVDIATGVQTKKVTIDNQYFGEGIAIINNKVYQLTWKNHVGFIYDFRTFKKIGEFKNDLEGWGLTDDSESLIMSDGSDKLFFLDTLTLKIKSSVVVKENNIPQKNLNELEYIDGFVYANQWQTDFILKINPKNGKVVERFDMSSLTNEARRMNRDSDVLNGIAYEKTSKLFLITGKNWPLLFAVRFKSDSANALN